MKQEKNFSHIIFENYFDCFEDPECTTQDKADFAEALQQYTKGNFDYQSPNKYVRGVLRRICKEMKARHEAYLAKCAKLRENSRKGGEANRRRIEALKAAEAQPNGSNRPAASGLAQQPAKAPQPPQEPRREAKPNGSNMPAQPAGSPSKLRAYYKAFAEASRLDLPDNIEASQADLFRWRFSEPEARAEVLPALLEAVANQPQKSTIEISSSFLRSLEKRELQPMPRPAWKLLAALAELAGEPEAKRFGGIEGLLKAFDYEASRLEYPWEILRNKAAYMLENKVLNLAGFLKARK